MDKILKLGQDLLLYNRMEKMNTKKINPKKEHMVMTKMKNLVSYQDQYKSSFSQ